MLKKELNLNNVQPEDYLRYYQKLRQYALNLRRTKFYNADPVEDILQNTFISFARSLKRNNSFETEKELYGRLKIHLYQSFVHSVDPRYNESKYNVLRSSNERLLTKKQYQYHVNLDNKLISKYLTPKQKEVYFFISRGYDQKDVADKLGISKQAVNYSMKYIKKKLNKLFS